MKRALIACGGTGGHLAPGIALAEVLFDRGWKCELVISSKQVDSRLVTKYDQFDYIALPGSGLSYSPIRFLKFLGNLVGALYLCAKKIRATRPDIVVGFGGFLSASVLITGRFLGRPIAIHEANQVAGRVTRMASRFAQRVYLPEGVSLPSAQPNRIRYVGMPLRSEIVRLPKEEAKKRLGFDSDKKLLFVFGGSQGAVSLTNWVEASIETLAQFKIQTLCLTGLGSGKSGEVFRQSEDGELIKSIFMGFSDQMALMLSAADLVISRSGAGSIAEIERCRVPAILIPYPHAADDHQHFNAKRFESLGGGIAVSNDSIDRLLDLTMDLFSNPRRLEEMEAELERRAPADARVEIAEDLESLLNGEAHSNPKKMALTR